MIKSIKQIKAEVNARIKGNEIVRDDEGRAIINMTVRDDSSFLSPYSDSNSPVISEEVADFLSNSALAYAPKEPLALNVYSNCIDDNEQKAYRTAIRHYYERHYKTNETEMKRTLSLSIIMFIIGLVTLSMLFVASSAGRFGEVWIEVVDIFAWVFLWEAVDLFFLTRTVERMKRRRMLSFVDIKISFFDLKQNV